MARIRSIKPEFWADEKLGPLEPIDRLVFLGLVSMADDAGRLVDSVRQIDGMLFPFTDETCGPSLDILARLSRIRRYTSGSGQRLIQVAGWDKHQKVDNPAKYVLPPPPPEVPVQNGVAPSSRDPIENVDTPSRDPRVPILDLGPTTLTPLSNATASDGVAQVFEHWRQASGHFGSKLTKDRRAKIKARLSTYTIEQLNRAVSNACSDPFYRGDNDRGKRFDFPETLLKNDAAVDRHLNGNGLGRAPPAGRSMPAADTERLFGPLKPTDW